MKMGSDESHFNVSLIVSDKVTRRCPQITPSVFEEKGEPNRYRTEVPLLYQPNPLPLGQTDSNNRRLEEGCCMPMLGVWGRRLTFVGPDVSGWGLLSQSRLRVSNSACHLPRLTE